MTGFDHAGDQLTLLLGRDSAVDRALEDVLGRQLGIAGPAGGVDERDVVALHDVPIWEDERRSHTQLASSRIERTRDPGGGSVASFGGHHSRIAARAPA